MSKTSTPSNPQQPAAVTPPRLSVDEMTSYRDGFRNLLFLVIVECIVIVGLLGGVFYCVSSVHPQDGYYAENVNGTKRRMIGLNQPNMNQNTVLTWAAAAVTQIMSFGFNDLDQSMEAAKADFTPEGWTSFNAAIHRGSLLRTLINNQQLLTSVPIATPELMRMGLFGGDLVWVVNMSIVMTTRAADQKSSTRARVRLMITKMPTAQNPMGIGIKAFYLY
ncbi:MAG: hypothetical protein GC185_07535 [Alphaproteobacteria bacterium]|nr:hypothetical protein [Alphaproteobacteria bacterium]